ncbi:MAG: hypothetical protein ABIP54_01615 [Candidatus Andersenbacteria bacterium]
MNTIAITFVEFVYYSACALGYAMLILVCVAALAACLGVFNRWKGETVLYVRSLPDGAERWQEVEEGRVTLLDANETILLIRFYHGVFAHPPKLLKIVSENGTVYATEDLRWVRGGSEHLVRGKGISPHEYAVEIVLQDISTGKVITFPIKWENAKVDELA